MWRYVLRVDSQASLQITSCCFFYKLQNTFDPQDIWNIDETGISSVLARKEKSPHPQMYPGRVFQMFDFPTMVNRFLEPAATKVNINTRFRASLDPDICQDIDFMSSAPIDRSVQIKEINVEESTESKLRKDDVVIVNDNRTDLTRSLTWSVSAT